MFAKYYHTLINLKLIQIRYQLWYRIRRSWRKLSGFNYSLFICKEGYPLILKPWIEKSITFNNYTFTFLNQTRVFPDFSLGEDQKEHTIIWNEVCYGKLWAYNLNYMDYLLQTGIEKETGFLLIKQFINGLPKNKIGLEPYPISLRGINWIKFLSSHIMKEPEKISKQTLPISRINTSLYAQYQILLDNLEFHLLGNHLLENAFSLLFGALYFHDKYIWIRANQLLEKELEKQILSDGAHFELSPMYHQIILDRLLDCINLVQNNKRFDRQESLLTRMKEKAEKMLQWLNYMTFSNGEIPLFNDSAFGIAPTTNQLNEYAKRLGIFYTNSSRSIVSSYSGYHKFYGKNYECIFDVGAIGPLYQPGHVHADTFTFELYIKGIPVIVDTGTSTYSKGERRRLERGSISHNTVTINTEDTSDVWASHRVGRQASVNLITDKDGKVSVSHDGYRRFNTRINRVFESDNDFIVIIDEINIFQKKNRILSSDSSRIVTTRLHFHPSRKAKLQNQILYIDGLAEISFDGLLGINMVEYCYAPEFNKLIKSLMCEMTFNKKLLTKISIYNSQ